MLFDGLFGKLGDPTMQRSPDIDPTNGAIIPPTEITFNGETFVAGSEKDYSAFKKLVGKLQTEGSYIQLDSTAGSAVKADSVEGKAAISKAQLVLHEGFTVEEADKAVNNSKLYKDAKALEMSMANKPEPEVLTGKVTNPPEKSAPFQSKFPNSARA